MYIKLVTGALLLALANGAVGADGSELAKRLRQQTTPVPYQNDADAELIKVVDSYRPGKLYAALRLTTRGVDTDAFDCSNKGWLNRVKTFFLTDGSFTSLEVSLKIGRREMPWLPVLLLSDREDDCRYRILDSRRITPKVKIEGDTDVVVRYRVRHTATNNVSFFDNTTTLWDAAVKAVSVEAVLMSAMSKKFVDFKSDRFEQGMRASGGQPETVGEVSVDFDFRKQKGITFTIPGTDGKPIEISLEVEASLSHYTPFVTADDTGVYYPDFKGKGIGSILGAAVYPSDSYGDLQSVSLNAHFVRDDLARSKLRSLGTSEPRDFIDACVEIRDDLQNRVGLNDYDVAVTLYGLLSRSRWVDKATFRTQQECPDKAEIALMQEFGLDITPLTRELDDDQRAQIRRAFNRKLDQIARSLKFASRERKLKVFDSSLARDNIWLLDPADAMSVPFEKAADREAIIQGLSSLTASNAGCYVTESSQKMVRRTMLVARQHPHTPRLALSFTIESDDIREPRFEKVEVTPVRAGDSESKALIDRLLATEPTSACLDMLRERFSDFDGVEPTQQSRPSPDSVTT